MKERRDDAVTGGTSWGAVVVVAALLGGVLFLFLHHSSSAAAPPDATTAAGSKWSNGANLTSRSGPVRIVIHAIGVNAPVIRLGLNPDGTLEVPTVFTQTGWWSGGPAPGQKGPAVIVGHVDSFRGPAVFYRLKALKRGDVIVVTRADGKTARFSVLRHIEVPKSHFPTSTVYGDVPYPGLRLITCGGSFDQSTGHYVDNVIVFARLID
jgi:sortase (surface protein transpeptidase)